jgi:hypothetical protein
LRLLPKDIKNFKVLLPFARGNSANCGKLSVDYESQALKNSQKGVFI